MSVRNYAHLLIGVRARADPQWGAEKATREERIQALYNQVEVLWHRLEVGQDPIDLFIEMNRGSGEGTIKAVGGPRLVLYILVLTWTVRGRTRKTS